MSADMDRDKKFKTDQETFWAGEFGTEYIDRNQGENLLASNLNFFAKALHGARDLGDCLEFGANIGMNLQALKLLFPQIDAHGIEINPDACAQLRQLIGPENVFEGSLLDFEPERRRDLVIIKGVLIHLNPDVLPQVYEKLYQSCGRFLLIAEYYNPSPVAISYRGFEERLFKRDFAGEMMETYRDLTLADYGFAYRHDPSFPQDDITWFLLEKSAK